MLSLLSLNLVLLSQSLCVLYVRRKERRERNERPYQSSAACVPDIGCEVSVPSTYIEIPVTVDITEPETSSQSVLCQCNLQTDMNSPLSIESFKDNPRVVKYYTGFQHYDHFMLMFNVLGPAEYNLNYQCLLLKPEDQFFPTLMKLRQAKDDIELSLLFNISESTVSQLIITWFNVLYFQLQEINIWPEKSVVQDHMPLNFGKVFKFTRVVLDATEISITKPTNIHAQSSTYSTYKSRNTLKTMIGCTPRGLVSYIGPSYGGSASDRQIIERSPLCKDVMFEKGDSIMADRGIMVQDLFSSKDVFVNTPTMLKGKSQLEPEMVVRDRRISSKRIHVKRVIGLTKFKKKNCQPVNACLGLGSYTYASCYQISALQLLMDFPNVSIAYCLSRA